MRDSEIEALMIGHSARRMKANDSPLKQFRRLGLEARLICKLAIPVTSSLLLIT